VGTLRPAPVDQLVPTPVGQGRITWYEAESDPRALVALGHGSATGIDAADLQALALALPEAGFTVALVTYPYRVNGGWGASEFELDTAWRALWPEFEKRGLPVVAGGRSAGSQVACRTAKALGARAVLALAYPLRGPGSATELLASGVPTLIVQGGDDSYGRPGEFPRLPASMELVEVAGSGHTFGTRAPGGRERAMETITFAAAAWLERFFPVAGE
jgi:predicted alpha/beta-hydrolase family hydrolase